MKITDVETLWLRSDTVLDEANGTQDALVIRVHTDEDIIGLGEVDSAPEVAAAAIRAKMSHSVSKGLRDLIVGQDPLRIAPLWKRMFDGSIYHGRRGAVVHAISGIDIALWDIAGKALNKPVYTLLGGAFNTNIRAYGSVLFGASPSETGEKALRLRDEGFTAVKFGWGPFGQTINSDIAHIRTVRNAIGPDCLFMVDAGGVLDVAYAIELAKRMEEFDIYWFEEPLPADDLDGYARLSRQCTLRIAAGEQCITRFDFRDLIERGDVSIVQPDLARCGGITEGRRIATHAGLHARKVVPHAYSTGILTAASLHFAAATEECLLVEYPRDPSEMASRLTTPAFRMTGGIVSVPDRPGLGVDLNEETVRRYLQQQHAT